MQHQIVWLCELHSDLYYGLAHLHTLATATAMLYHASKFTGNVAYGLREIVS